MSSDHFSAQCCCHQRLELGEGVRWDARRGELLWVDVHRGLLHTAPATAAGVGPVEVLDVGGPLTAVFPLPHPEDGWLVGHGPGLAALSRAGELRPLAAPEQRRPGHTRVNDGACDARGRLWLGSMEYSGAAGQGQLYRVEIDGRLTVAVSPTTVSNGIGWSPDGATMYFVDSGPGTVTAYGYDAATGDLHDPRVLVRVSEDGAVPDGMCIDDEGCLWLAIWDGGQVRRYAPDGSLLARVDVPARRPSCCAFGGPDRDVLFITSARVGLTETDLSHQPHAGCLFAVDVGVRGPAALPYQGPLEIADES
ncbi:MAG TPA: SMP-30/gluconolactonase/LRE family protein [Jatrophihabitans sp.]|nr:SMP-30/gluconolactonase/LRE family protein [Jatrophihabitans sp.]